MASPNSAYTQLITTTLAKQRGMTADNVSKGNALLYAMKKRGNMEIISGGRTIVEELEYAEAATFQRYSGYDLLNIGASDIITAAEFDPVQAAVNITISGREMRQNKGKEAMIKIASKKTENAVRTMANAISRDIYSDGSAPNQIGGLKHLVADDPSTGVVGGIDSAVYSFWRNKTLDMGSFDISATASAANIRSGMNHLWLNCTRGNDTPDLIVADANYYNFYESSLQALQRYADVESASAGFIALKYKSANVIYDGDSGISSDHMYFLNTKFLRLVAYQGANFEVLESKVSLNQDAEVIPIIFMGNLTCSNRSLQGVIFE